MPSWGEVLNEISGIINKSPWDDIRRKYLAIMSKYTGRNIIAYYSGFLQKKSNDSVSIDDNDKNAFMQVIYGLDKSKGLDLILHTPGGNLAATESIVTYLRNIFGNNIMAFIPQIAMSAGTMIALSCKEIVMEKESNIGPIDPQFGGMSCDGVIEEFNRALTEVKKDPASIPLWQCIVSKYIPTFLGDCKKAIDWSKEMVEEWLKTNMLSENPDKAKDIVDNLSNHSTTYNHSKHIHLDECKKLGLVVSELESFKKQKISNCNDLQDCVLTIHHAYMHTFSNSNAVKIVENHNGNAMIINAPLNIASAPVKL